MRPAPPQAGLYRFEAWFSGHAYDPHRHDSYGLGVTFSGVQSFDYRGARADSLPGHAIVLYPDEVHDGRAGADGGFGYRMLYLEPRLIQEALGYGRALPFIGAAVSRDRRLVRVLSRALGELDRPVEELEGDGLILAIAEVLAALDPSAPPPPRFAASTLAVRRARAFLDAAVDRPVRSDEIEAASGLDRFALARHFRRILGTSPYRYLVMRRLDLARRLIGSGQGLADAALTAGFADQAHMTRHFVAAYGVPPGRWRALQRR